MMREYNRSMHPRHGIISEGLELPLQPLLHGEAASGRASTAGGGWLPAGR